MHLPTALEALGRLEKFGVITADEAARYRSNYEHFEKNRGHIYERFPSQWVASLNGQLYARPTQQELEKAIAGEEGSRFAYIEEIVPRAIDERVPQPPQLTSNDLLQRYLLNEQEVKNHVEYGTPKEDDEELAKLKEHIEKRVAEATMGAQITTAIRLLMLQGMKDEEIIAWGRHYFVKYVSPSVPIWQTVLKETEQRPYLPNDETELRGIRLAKDICRSLIRDFGVAEKTTAQ